MFNHALVEEVEKFEILFAKVTAARALPLDTIDFGTGLPLRWDYYNFEGELAVALYDGVVDEPIILTVEFIRNLARLCLEQGKDPEADITTFYPMDLISFNGNSWHVLAAGYTRECGGDLAWIGVGGRSTNIYVDPVFLTEAADRLDA